MGENPDKPTRARWWFVFGFLLCFDNFPPTYRITGLTSGSPALVILLVLYFTQRTGRTKTERVIARCIGGLIVYSAVMICVSIVQYGHGVDPLALQVGGTPVLAKAIRTLFIVVLWCMAVLLGARLALSRPRALVYVGLGLVVGDVLGLLLQLSGAMSSGAVDSFHAVLWHDNRPRGFDFESSIFGASLLSGLGLACARLRPTRALIVMIVIGIPLASLTTSRGTLISAIAGPVIYVAIAISRDSRLARLTAYIAIPVATFGVAFFGFYFATSTLWRPLAHAGSDATRTGWGLVAWKSLAYQPLGLNVFSYWLQVQDLLGGVLARLTGVFHSSDLVEFTTLATQSGDDGLSPKTLPALAAVWFGIPGVVLAIWAMTSAAVRSASQVRGATRGIGVGVCTAVVGLATYNPGTFCYEIGLLLGAGLAAGSVPRAKEIV